jgi:multidrug resistance protein
MKTEKKNLALIILTFIMFVNAVAYGIIIPLLYPYAARFGINAVGLSLLFASFSFAQFIATPILGRLSDKFGRKPVLLFCLLGTSASLALFAMATNITMLFIARVIDGITGGNISVAQAIIADTTKGESRAKSFALLGGALGFGFLVGPGLGGLISHFGLSAPFWFASGLALMGTLLGSVILKETLPKEKRQASNKPIFQLKTLVQSLFWPITGVIILINFLAALAQNAFIIGIQSFTVDFLKMNPSQIGLLFVWAGLITIFTQVFGIRLLLNNIRSKKMIVVGSLTAATITMALLAFQYSIPSFMVVFTLFALLSSAVVPVITGILSERTKAEDQGGILGINQSYTSLGQVFGPLAAGAVAATVNIPSIFLLSAAFFGCGLVASHWLYIPVKKKFDL